MLLFFFYSVAFNADPSISAAHAGHSFAQGQCTSLDIVWLRLQTQLSLGLVHRRVSGGRCNICDWLTRAQLFGAREEPVGTKHSGKLVENGAVSRNKEKSLLLL